MTRRAGYFLVLVILTLAGTGALGRLGFHFDRRQLLSIAIFSTFIFGTLLFGELRLALALGGVALLLALNLLTIEQLPRAAKLDVLIFLASILLVVGYLEQNEFFEHLVGVLVRLVGPRPQAILIVLMLSASAASAVLGEVAGILCMIGVLLHLTSRYKLNCTPF